MQKNITQEQSSPQTPELFLSQSRFDHKQTFLHTNKAQVQSVQSVHENWGYVKNSEYQILVGVPC